MPPTLGQALRATRPVLSNELQCIVAEREPPPSLKSWPCSKIASAKRLATSCAQDAIRRFAHLRRRTKSGWSYEKTSSGARRHRTGHRWSANRFSGRSEGSRRTDRQSGRSGIWPRYYPDGLGTRADRIGARKFKLRHYPNFL